MVNIEAEVYGAKVYRIGKIEEIKEKVVKKALIAIVRRGLTLGLGRGSYAEKVLRARPKGA